MISQIKEMIWGMPTVVLILLFGVYFSFKTRFIQITGLGSMFRCIKNSMISDASSKGISSLAALSTALGGTVGIGSIVGVGFALSVGGTGSIFWMWISGFFGMVIKYTEVFVSVKYRERSDGIYVGGTMYCLKSEGKKAVAVAFSLLCIFASFGVGNLTQTSAVSDILYENGVSRIISGLLLAGIIAFAVFGGQKRIAKISEYMIPGASIVYFILTFYIIITILPAIPSVFSDIFKSAFGFRQAAGGITGSLLMTAMRTGMTRGVFSNEAGMGSSPMAHAAAENAEPHKQGLWGIFEIVIDTFVVSTITALCLIGSGTNDVGVMFKNVFGKFGVIILPVLLIIFAFASVISWSYYGESCIKFLAGKNYKKYLLPYRTATVILAFVGANIAITTLWDLADILNACMIFPNLYMLFLKRKDINLCHGNQKRKRKYSKSLKQEQKA